MSGGGLQAPVPRPPTVLTDSQCKLVPTFAHFLDVVLQVVEEQLHHVQLLLRPPETAHKHSQNALTER